jgi:L-fucose mutarotase
VIVMLKSQLLHPQILSALARAGHGSKVLISDGNYPHWTRRGPNSDVIYLNLSPGVISCTDALRALLSAIPIEKAEVMDYEGSGAQAMKSDPPIWKEFAQILKAAGFDGGLEKVEKFQFYGAAGTPEVCLTIATADERIFANLLLTIGVVMPNE